MQTPAGFRMEEGRALLTSFIDAAINHSSLIRYLHVVLAGWITGSILTAAIASWYLLRGRDTELAKPLLKTAMILFIVTALLQLGSGHSHSVQVTKTQPAKMAAFEALWQSQEGAPLALFGIPDEEKEVTYLNVGIPKLLSLLAYFDPNARILGLNEFPKGDRPPVFLPYASYHIMIALGMLFFALALLGGVLLALKRLSDTKWFLRILLLSAPLPLLASEFGWIAAEVGRQPWAVYGILKTADAHSLVVPAGQILFTLVMFGLIYSLLFVMFIFLLMKLIKKGPEKIAAEGY
jgi:cytochrome d ubiquinol oxidase subunit I